MDFESLVVMQFTTSNLNDIATHTQNVQVAVNNSEDIAKKYPVKTIKLVPERANSQSIVYSVCITLSNEIVAVAQFFKFGVVTVPSTGL